MARLVFLGTPQEAVAPLEVLVQAGHDVALVVTRADAKRGRGGAHEPSPVKSAAVDLGLPVTSTIADVVETGAELGVVVAFGRIIPAAVLDRLPMVNVHFSLLPRWRGAAPVERAILEGDAETGVCLMEVATGLDTGAVYASVATAIAPEESAASLRRRLVCLACELLEEHLASGLASLPTPHDQAGEPSYAEKIDAAELELHWRQPALRVRRVIRLGRAWTTFRGHRLGVLEAEPVEGEPATADGDAAAGTLVGDQVVTGDRGRVRLVTVQPAGGRTMTAADWLRGVRAEPGERLGD